MFYGPKPRNSYKKRRGYMESARDRGGVKRKAMEIGPATVERIVCGRYEWRDGSYRAPKRRQDQDETRDRTRQRPHDPG